MLRESLIKSRAANQYALNLRLSTIAQDRDDFEENLAVKFAEVCLRDYEQKSDWSSQNRSGTESFGVNLIFRKRYAKTYQQSRDTSIDICGHQRFCT